MASKLTDSEVASRMESIKGWSRKGELIERTFSFADFVTAIRFVDRISVEAERTQHHPDIEIKYNKVTLGYSTHDAGGLTAKDFDGAVAADVLADSIMLS